MTNIRIGMGYDVHRLDDDLPLILGGVDIEYTKGIVAHSDGDVLLHAITDALLGAAALGDIGHFFPDTDPKFKNINSAIILHKVCDKLKNLSFNIINVDATIVLEKPKLAPYINSIKKSVASLLNIPLDHTNIKATTSETMGFVGRGEGIICYASVLIEKT